MWVQLTTEQIAEQYQCTMADEQSAPTSQVHQPQLQRDCQQDAEQHGQEKINSERHVHGELDAAAQRREASRSSL